MARPPAGPPPVATSAVARVDEKAVRKDVANYLEIQAQLTRPDRWAELVAMCGGDEQVAQRLKAVALHSISTDSDLLLNAAPMTIIQAVKDSFALGLEATGLLGEGWIIRYKTQATFLPGWRGYLKRIRNSGAVQDIDVQVVYSDDVFEYGWTERGGWFRHSPGQRELVDGALRGYWGAYAYAVMPSGFVELEVMTRAQIDYVRDTFSESAKSGKPGPWDTSYGEMSRKTVLKVLSKRLPQSAVDRLLEVEARADVLREAEPAGPQLNTGAARARAIAAAQGVVAIGPGSDREGEEAAGGPDEAERAAAETVVAGTGAEVVEPEGLIGEDVPFI